MRSAGKTRFEAVLLLSFLLLPVVRGQERPQPADVIQRLTRQVGRAEDPINQLGVFTCGSYLEESSENRALARELVGFGAASLPSLEDAFDALSARGLQSPFAVNAIWMFFAYAKIKGSSAQFRLRRMIGDPKLVSLQSGLDASIALSLGLTSYVSGSREISRAVLCRPEEPRDSLDQLILAWERDSRRSFEAILGPASRAALSSLLKGRTWDSMRASLWHGRRSRDTSLGYRLEAPGRWSEPAETLEESSAEAGSIPTGNTLETNVRLTSGTGADCGMLVVKFVRATMSETSPNGYLVDSSDLESLLRSITSCAA